MVCGKVLIDLSGGNLHHYSADSSRQSWWECIDCIGGGGPVVSYSYGYGPGSKSGPRGARRFADYFIMERRMRTLLPRRYVRWWPHNLPRWQFAPCYGGWFRPHRYLYSFALRAFIALALFVSADLFVDSPINNKTKIARLRPPPGQFLSDKHYTQL